MAADAELAIADSRLAQGADLTPGGDSAIRTNTTATDTSAAVSGHDLSRQAIQARKGGTIGTAGRGSIALRFDDYPHEFVDKVLPLLEERRLPFTRVTTSESVNGVALPGDTFPVMQDYCIRSGGEVFNHGRTHVEQSADALDSEISGALDALRAAMPRIPIDCFAPPGGSITWGGYMPSTSVENYTDSYAGRLIMSRHGLVTGYFRNSYYWPIDGIMRDGQNHYSVDNYVAARGIELVERARDWRVGIVMMWHAARLDTTGYATMDDLTQILDHLAARRDAGEVVVLTVSGLAAADLSSDYRRDPLVTHCGHVWAETFIYPQYRRELPGSTRELTATVTGTAGARVSSVIGESTLAHTIPSAGILQLRHPATIPTDTTALTVSITGGAVTDAHLYAI